MRYILFTDLRSNPTLFVYIYTEAFIVDVIYTLVIQTKELYKYLGDSMTVMKHSNKFKKETILATSANIHSKCITTSS